MKRSRTLLRLLVLVGSLILLLDTRHRGLATYSGECGQYDTRSQIACPSPCTIKYYNYPYQGEGPYYVSNPNSQACTGVPSDGCTAGTVVYTNETPERSDACGCGATGQYCDNGSNCCGTDFCQDNVCVSCISDGYGDCDTNADCCSGYCDDDSTCQALGGGGGGGGGGTACDNDDDCQCGCNTIIHKCYACEQE